MPRERKRRPDLDERFSLHPMHGEDVLRRVLEKQPVPQGPNDQDDEEVTEDS